LRYQDAYLRNFTSRLLTYALGRGISAPDMPTVRRIVRNAGEDHRFGSIVLNIVTSEPFQMRRAELQAAGKEVALAQHPLTQNKGQATAPQIRGTAGQNITAQ